MNLRSWLFLALSLTVAALCARLGFWQLARLEERRARNREIRSGLASEPLELDDAVEEAQLEPYRPVRARGQFDAAQQVILTARTYEGRSGAHLLTPLRLESAEVSVLVDRGWIPFQDRSSARLESYRVEGTVEIQGITKPSQELPNFPLLPPRPTSSPEDPRFAWPAIDVSAIGAQIPYDLLPVYVVLTEPVPPQATEPIPDPGLDLSEGPHMGYAIQWFSFALIALIGGGYWTWTRTAESG